MGESDLKSLSAHGFSFNKSLGQNFVTDKNLLRAICADASITGEDCVVEVGVGAAALTKCLAERAEKVIGYEIDRRLEPVINECLKDDKNVTVIYRDIMKEPGNRIEELCGSRFKVAANLPYYITTPVIMKFIEESEQVDSITVMVQEEVARRLCASAGDSDYGGISAVIRYAGLPRITRKVSRRMFTPIPNVDSAVVHIELNCNNNRNEFEFYRKVVRAAFSMRRKTLVNNLAAAFKIDKERLKEILSLCGFTERVRGEELSCGDYIRLAAFLKEV